MGRKPFPVKPRLNRSPADIDITVTVKIILLTLFRMPMCTYVAVVRTDKILMLQTERTNHVSPESETQSCHTVTTGKK